jgi:prepilin peptidase CpaA
MNTSQQQLILAGCALLCAVIGSIHDLRDRRIPNWVTGPAILGGLMLHTFVGHWSGLASSALAGLTAGCVALVFFLAGGMGAGDVKLMAAVGCIAGVASLQVLLLSIAFAGALFGLAVAAYRGRLHETLANVGSLLAHFCSNGVKPHPELNLENPATLRLPFALPITAGCLVTLCTVALEVRS